MLAADETSRKALILRWAAFGCLALIAACCTPYGWNALLAAQKILSLGGALPLLLEWKPADFGSIRSSCASCSAWGSRCIVASRCR